MVVRQTYVTPTALTHWGRVVHIYVSKLTIIGSDNGFSPGRHKAIFWANAEILLIQTKFIEILSEFHAFSLRKVHLKMSPAKWPPFSLGLNVLSSLSDLQPSVWQNSMTSVTITHRHTVYPRNYAHHWNLVVFWSQSIFIHIIQFYFIAIVVMLRLPMWQWSNSEEKGYVNKLISGKNI